MSETEWVTKKLFSLSSSFSFQYNFLMRCQSFLVLTVCMICLYYSRITCGCYFWNGKKGRTRRLLTLKWEIEENGLVSYLRSATVCLFLYFFALLLSFIIIFFSLSDRFLLLAVSTTTAALSLVVVPCLSIFFYRFLINFCHITHIMYKHALPSFLSFLFPFHSVSRMLFTWVDLISHDLAWVEFVSPR